MQLDSMHKQMLSEKEKEKILTKERDRKGEAKQGAAEDLSHMIKEQADSVSS